MSKISEILTNLSDAIRKQDRYSLVDILSEREFPGLDKNGNGMKLETMVNAVSCFLEKYNYLLKHKLNISSLNSDKAPIYPEIDFYDKKSYAADGAVGFFAFDNSINRIENSETERIPTAFCCSCYNLSGAVFPNAKIIDPYAFTDCVNLSYLVLPMVEELSNKSFQSQLLNQYPSTKGVFSGTGISTINLPNLTTTTDNAFRGCKNLYSISSNDLPNYTGGGTHVFADCTNLSSVILNKLTTLSNGFFSSCGNLTSVEFQDLSYVKGTPFFGCSNLNSVTIRKTTPPTITSANIFEGTKIGDGTGYIYVPTEAVSTYKQATNWAQFADQIVAIN